MTPGEAPRLEPGLTILIGRSSRRAAEPISEIAVRRYVDATGDDNPLWLDEGFARSQGFAGRLVPPLLIGWEPFSVRERHADMSFYTPVTTRRFPFPEDFADRRFGEIEFEWDRAVLLGEALEIIFRIVDIRYHVGRSGPSLHATWSESIVDKTETRVCARRQTLIMRKPQVPDQEPKAERLNGPRA